MICSRCDWLQISRSVRAPSAGSYLHCLPRMSVRDPQAHRPISVSWCGLVHLLKIYKYNAVEILSLSWGKKKKEKRKKHIQKKLKWWLYLTRICCCFCFIYRHLFKGSRRRSCLWSTTSIFYWTFLFTFLSFPLVAVVIVNRCFFCNLSFLWSTDVMKSLWCKKNSSHWLNWIYLWLFFFLSFFGYYLCGLPVLWLSCELFALPFLLPSQSQITGTFVQTTGLMKDALSEMKKRLFCSPLPCVMLHKWTFSFLECAIKFKTVCDSLVLELWGVTSLHLYQLSGETVCGPSDWLKPCDVMYTTPIGCVNFLHPNKTINVLWSEIVTLFLTL